MGLKYRDIGLVSRDQDTPVLSCTNPTDKT